MKLFKRNFFTIRHMRHLYIELIIRNVSTIPESLDLKNIIDNQVVFFIVTFIL